MVGWLILTCVVGAVDITTLFCCLETGGAIVHHSFLKVNGDYRDTVFLKLLPVLISPLNRPP